MFDACYSLISLPDISKWKGMDKISNNKINYHLFCNCFQILNLHEGK